MGALAGAGGGAGAGAQAGLVEQQMHSPRQPLLPAYTHAQDQRWQSAVVPPQDLHVPYPGRGLAGSGGGGGVGGGGYTDGAWSQPQAEQQQQQRY